MNDQERLDKILALQDELFDLYSSYRAVGISDENPLVFYAGLAAWEATRLFWYAVKGDEAEMNNKFELTRRALDSFLRRFVLCRKEPRRVDTQIEAKIIEAMRQTLALMRQGKPKEESERARRYDIAIAEMEKTFAYFKVYVGEYIDSSPG